MKNLRRSILGLTAWFEENILSLSVISLLLFIPLYPKFPLQEVSGTYVAIRIDDLVAAAAIFAWLIFQAKNRFPVLKERVFKLFVLYWLAGLIVNLNSLNNFGLTNFKLAMLHWLRRVEYMSLFIEIHTATKKQSDYLGISKNGPYQQR